MSQVLLIRHGQASWGAPDYDVLSGRGHEQSRVLGKALASRALVPSLVMSGAMRRQQDTADGLVASAGWSLQVEVDRDWDEMDHQGVLSRQPRTFDGSEPTPREFLTWFDTATRRWTSGEHDQEYDESFPAFGDRVRSAFDRLLACLGPSETAVVVTSGGPIAWTCADLLDGGVALHVRLAAVILNASVTKVVVGSAGSTLVSFNEHSHLGMPGLDLLTYR